MEVCKYANHELVQELGVGNVAGTESWNSWYHKLEMLIPKVENVGTINKKQG